MPDRPSPLPLGDVAKLRDGVHEAVWVSAVMVLGMLSSAAAVYAAVVLVRRWVAGARARVHTQSV